MRVVFQMSAIVATLALAGCGQSGSLYLPTVPPLPPKPVLDTQSDVTPDAASDSAAANAATNATASGSTGTSLQFSPTLSAPAPASTANPTR